MDSKCASSRAKWRTVLLMTTSAQASSKDICSTGFDSKIRRRKRGREHPGEGADAIHGLRVRVRRVNFVPFPQEVDEVSTGTASGVQYSHSG